VGGYGGAYGWGNAFDGGRWTPNDDTRLGKAARLLFVADTAIFGKVRQIGWQESSRNRR
jgi:hypothetical protein